jgi:transcription-repair coupling factor (superfamily II helicase)
MELKLLAQHLAITKIENIAGRVRLFIAAESPVSPEKLLSLHEKNRKKLRFLPEGGIELDMRDKEWNEIHMKLKEILEGLAA